MTIYRSDFPDVDVIDLPIHDAVLGRAAEYGDRPALVDGITGTTVTYAELDQRTRRLAAGLAEIGVRKGDVIALYSPNTIAYPVVFYAATRAGATVTTVNALYTVDELGRQLRDAKARFLVTISAFLPVAAAAGEVDEIFVCDTAKGYRSIEDLMRSPATELAITIDPASDVAVLPYSSGTTGACKGVMLTHRNIGTNLAQIESTTDIAAGERLIAILPFFHIYGLTVLMNLPLRRGAAVVVLPKFDLEQFLRVLAEHKITRAYVAPPVVLALAKHPAVDGYNLSSLKHVTSAAAPLDAELAEACAKRLGLPAIHQAYGMTELSPGTHATPQDDPEPPPGAVGKLFASTEMRIVGPDGADVSAGDTGEIWIRGPQVMKGYLGRPEDTDATIDADGWLHTGDLGRADERGYLYVVDRVKELIKYKGYQVPPAELEAVLLTDPRITDAAVIGVLDAEGNEVPKAFVVPAEADLSEDDVLTYVAARVAPHKKVRQVEFIEAVPKAASGKILRRELRARP